MSFSRYHKFQFITKCKTKTKVSVVWGHDHRMMKIYWRTESSSRGLLVTSDWPFTTISYFDLTLHSQAVLLFSYCHLEYLLLDAWAVWLIHHTILWSTVMEDGLSKLSSRATSPHNDIKTICVVIPCSSKTKQSQKNQQTKSLGNNPTPGVTLVSFYGTPLFLCWRSTQQFHQTLIIHWLWCFLYYPASCISHVNKSIFVYPRLKLYCVLWSAGFVERVPGDIYSLI